MAKQLIFHFPKFLSFLIILNFISCESKKENDIELIILNNEFVTFEYGLKKDTINIVNYYLENKSNDKFFIFNTKNDDVIYDNNYLYKYGFEFKVYNKLDGSEVEYDKDLFPEFFMNKLKKSKCDSVVDSRVSEIDNLEYKRMNYKGVNSYFETNKFKQNHFIYPGEKIYGRIYLNLTDTMKFEEGRLNYAKIFSNKEYYTEAFIISDTTDYKSILPKEVLKTIEENGVKIYHGVIKAKNKIPIKVFK